MTEVGLIPSLPVSRTIQVEGEEVLEDVLVGDVGGPAIGREDCRVEPLVWFTDVQLRLVS